MNFLMRLMFSNQWNAMLDLLNEKNKKIEELERENERLKLILIKSNFNAIYGSTACSDLDFPNSKKSYEDKLY